MHAGIRLIAIIAMLAAAVGVAVTTGAATAKEQLQAVPLPYNDTTFLSEWLGVLYPAISNATIHELSLPGTHDSMTYDLSTTVSDGANDLPPELAWILHEFHDLFPGPFVRNQSKTQGLDVVSQLNNGIRFIDFRIMYSAGSENPSTAPHDWYCLHFVETNNKAMTYLKQIKDWLMKHPSEVLVMWFSRHGNNCATGQDQYPNINNDIKRHFWREVESLFGPLLFNHTQGSTNETTIAGMLKRDQRLVAYVADYVNFTGSSDLAADSCRIDNQLGDSVANEPETLPALIDKFGNASHIKAADKAQGRFFLQSMAAGAPGQQIEDAAIMHFIPQTKHLLDRQCAAVFNIPNMTEWCPPTLQDISQLTNYYNQIALDRVITHGLDLPNAIYLDAVDTGGTIRTGTELFGTRPGLSNGKFVMSGVQEQHATTAFGYVDTFALYNLRRACNTGRGPSVTPIGSAGRQREAASSPFCETMDKILVERRSRHPLKLWDDAARGRLVGWPLN